EGSMTSPSLRAKSQLPSSFVQHRLAMECVLPDHILRRIAASTDPRVDAAQGDETTLRSKVLESLDLNASFRLARTGQAESRRSTRQFRRQLRQARRSLQGWAFSAEFTKDRTIYSADNTQRIPGVVARTEGKAATG